MASRTKKIAQKWSCQDQEPTPPLEVEFTDPDHQQRFECLQNLKFGHTRYIDWDAVGELDLLIRFESLSMWEVGIDFLLFVISSGGILH